MIDWLPGVERIPNPRSNGGTYLDDVPWRFTAHTTEAVPSTLEGARGMAERHEYPPHLWAWYDHDWVAQTVRLDRSAFALLHPAGTPETNKMRAIQLEIVGRAADTPGWGPEVWEWLGRRVLRPVIDAGYPINLSRVAPTTGPDGYGTRGKVRMSRTEWRGFDGVCCHANVPDNHHWDIGAGRLDLVAAAASPPRKDDDMLLLIKEKGTHPVYLWDGRWRWPVDSQAKMDILTFPGITTPGPNAPWHEWTREQVEAFDLAPRGINVDTLAAAIAARLPAEVDVDPAAIAAEVIDQIAGKLGA